MVCIFDLDGTLANCEHRRHFVDSSKLGTREDYENWIKPFVESKKCPEWKPDWKSFYEACDKDEPIDSTISIFEAFYKKCPHREIQIWSARCESVRKKTLLWLDYHINPTFNFFDILKMRPIGDTTPDDELKERWLEEQFEETKWGSKHNIDFVFDSDPKSIAMWRRRGIFVFDVNQSGKEF